jgi:hypothetical protein
LVFKFLYIPTATLVNMPVADFEKESSREIDEEKEKRSVFFGS